MPKRRRAPYRCPHYKSMIEVRAYKDPYSAPHEDHVVLKAFPIEIVAGQPEPKCEAELSAGGDIIGHMRQFFGDGEISRAHIVVVVCKGHSERVYKDHDPIAICSQTKSVFVSV